MYLFVIGHFFRRRRPQRATDPMPAAPLLQVLLFMVLYATAALLGALAVAAAMDQSMTAALFFGCGAAACLSGAVVFWLRLNH